MFFNLDQVTLYSDSRPLLKNLTYSFEKNKRYFFFGRSGVGKSLLLETLSGIYPHFSGQVERPSDTAKHSSFLFQRDCHKRDHIYKNQKGVAFAGRIKRCCNQDGIR